MYAYPVTLEHEDGEVLVDFPDIPWAHSIGDSEAEALVNAVDCLATAFDACIERREPIPEPSAPNPGQPVVIVPAVMAGKAALHNAMLAAGLRKADLARRMNIAPTLADRLLSLRHKSRIEQIENALAVLGKRLVVGVSAN
jgi:antitoxin HicB